LREFIGQWLASCQPTQCRPKIHHVMLGLLEVGDKFFDFLKGHWFYALYAASKYRSGRRADLSM
jgi:hypothetical protein